MFWKSPEWKILIYFLIMAFILYTFCLFLSSGFFIRIKPELLSFRDNSSALVKGVLAANVLILALVFFFFKGYRDVLFYHTLLSAAVALSLLPPVRFLECRYLFPHGPFRVLILGDEPYQHLYLQDIVLQLSQRQSEVLIALSGDNSGQQHHRLAAVGATVIHYISAAEARSLVENGAYLAAVVLSRDPLDKDLLELIPSCYQNGYSVMGMIPFYELVCRKVPLFQVGDSWLVHTSFQPPGLDNIVLKRAFDILFSFYMLIIFLPVGLLLALAIKLESKGPALFIQERTGKGGKTFRMFKFRSMELHKDDSHKWPHWEPDLVTKVGHFMRKTGLDEFPQLINILKGDMSFVGPRPARTLVTKRHIEKIPFYAISLSVRPGVSGWAQLRQGKDSGEQSILEKVRYNLYYAKNYSLLFDLEIILKTCRIALLSKKPDQYKAPGVTILSAAEQKSGEN